ncbi:long-chain acyl-CoA synthetase [Streptomyces sp. SAI-126]|uniref:AMP-binding protein n=1 Tax=Streptomyces sp. SAI-126 TaxID=3377732 RepID=UPI003C7B5A4E
MKDVVAALRAPGHEELVLVECLGDTGTPERTYTYGQMTAWADEVRAALRARGLAPGARVGLVADNSPEWVAADLALLIDGYTEVPVPLAFSAEQAASLLRDVHVCVVDAAGAAKLEAWSLSGSAEPVLVERSREPGVPAPAREVLPDAVDPDRIIKIIHTSGTTGAPKGVKIRAAGLGALLSSLDEVSPSGVYDRYLSLVPFSLLVEQVTAVYLPILRGGRMVLLPGAVPLLGTAGSRAEEALDWLRKAAPSAAVLPPALVSALDKAVRDSDGDELFPAGRSPFLMAGGAPVDAEALKRLDAAGLRVHEGYGLSENGSVVSWNTASHWRPGTVGRPLPHCSVKLSDQGELLVRSTSLFAGYTVEDPTSRPVDDEGWLHTGDRALIDEDGFIRILGRLKNVIITGHGRNVSPEWVEGRLRSCRDVADAVLFGEGMEHLVAVLVSSSRDGDAGPAVEREARTYAERALAETDRPERYIVLPDGADLRERYFTVTGRPRRGLIFDEIVRPALAPAA